MQANGCHGNCAPVPFPGPGGFDPDTCSCVRYLPGQYAMQDGGSSGGNPMDGGADLSKLHVSCPPAGCPQGLMAVTYFGFAGPSGPQLCSCEIPCAADAGACP